LIQAPAWVAAMLFENLLAWSEDYFYCLMGWTAKWPSPLSHTDNNSARETLTQPSGPPRCAMSVIHRFSCAMPYEKSKRGCDMSTECEDCLRAAGTLVDTHFGNSWSKAGSCSDECFCDGVVAAELARQLHAKHAAGDTQPWFLAAGFRNPHLPWYAPTKYFDRYHSAVGGARDLPPTPARELGIARYRYL
jgi:hypothetical protein